MTLDFFFLFFEIIIIILIVAAKKKKICFTPSNYILVVCTIVLMYTSLFLKNEFLRQKKSTISFTRVFKDARMHATRIFYFLIFPSFV